MSGETKSAKDKLDELEIKLDKYEDKIGLSIQPRICRYLNLELEQVKKFSHEELEDASFDLANFGLYLQKEINKHKSRVGWAEANIRMIVAKECNNVRAPSFEERRLLVISGNEHATKLEEIRAQEQICLDRLDFMNRRIDFLAERLSKIAESKRRNKYG